MHRYGATTTVVHTDVAGSTALPERVGPARRLGLLAEHVERLREHLPAYGGTLLRGGGDGRLLAFPSCRGALHWAVDVQRAAAGEPLLRFAMGIHVGEPAFHGDELHGRTVVKASRLGALARGGEVLVSRLARARADRRGPLEPGDRRAPGGDAQDDRDPRRPDLPQARPPRRVPRAPPRGRRAGLPARPDARLKLIPS